MQSLAHTVIPDDVGLPGASASTLIIFCEERLLDSADRVAARDSFGQTVLHLAVSKVAPLVFVEELIKQHKAKVNCVDYAGNTPLHVACSVRAVEHTVCLLQHGADATLLDGRGQVPDLSFLLREEVSENLRVKLAEQKRSKNNKTKGKLLAAFGPLACSCETLFAGDEDLMSAAAQAAKFEIAVPLHYGRSKTSPEGSLERADSPTMSSPTRAGEHSSSNPLNAFAAESSSSASSSSLFSPTLFTMAGMPPASKISPFDCGAAWADPPPAVVGTSVAASSSCSTPAVWFAVVPRVCHGCEHSLLCGGMLRFGGEFQFDGLPFALCETLCLPDDGVELVRFTSIMATSSSGNSTDDGEAAPPIVVELMTCTTDESLPTVLRCFADVSGSVAKIDAERRERERQEEEELAERIRRRSLAEGKMQQQQRKSNDDVEEESIHDKFKVRSLQMQAEGRASAIVRRCLCRHVFTTRFRDTMFLLRTRVLTVRRFLRRSNKIKKLAAGVLFFLTASFLRYAFLELSKFPAQCLLYAAIKSVVHSILLRIDDEKFTSESWLYRSITESIRLRQKRILRLATTTSPQPLSKILSRRERCVFAVGIEEILAAGIRNLVENRKDVLRYFSPVVEVARTRDGFLPRDLMYDIKKKPDAEAREIFETMAIGKVCRTLQDMALNAFKGRKNYLQWAISSSTENNHRAIAEAAESAARRRNKSPVPGGGGDVAVASPLSDSDLPVNFMTSPFRPARKLDPADDDLVVSRRGRSSSQKRSVSRPGTSGSKTSSVRPVLGKMRPASSMQR